MTTRPATPLGYSIFCDDIRQEIGNKTSLIGIYQGVLAFDSDFPITLPKLCILISWVQSADDPVTPVRIKVTYEPDGSDDELVLIDGELPVDRLANAKLVAEGANGLNTQAHVVLSPLSFERPGSLKVRAYYEGEEYRIGSLHVLRGPIQFVPAER